LLDTHIALWLAFQPMRLTEAEARLIADTANSIAVSAVSLWELRVKWERHFASGQRKGPIDPTRLIDALIHLDIEIVDLTGRAAVAELQPALDHSDPFDELLLAQAQYEGYRLLTRDAKLAAHPVALVA
jgi:PIN domain nuclease of toxin-antitoxin system